jgi:archaellum component FlaC
MGDKTPGASADAAREELEQRRTILQNLKDFDFQIKKNQEDIGNLTEKVESLSKDLDDLVSLYEIVSEQLNPFVGLSKVTKKRLDALENITKEVDTIKSKIGDLETSLEKGGLTLEEIKKKEPSSETIKISSSEVLSKTTTAQKAVPPSSTSTSSPTFSDDVQPYQDFNLALSETELDEILSKSLDTLRIEQNIDLMITEFFLTLK